jgi:hypothetical protein
MQENVLLNTFLVLEVLAVTVAIAPPAHPAK